METNAFYNAFDFERMDPTSGQDYRTPFQQDRDRIIHNAAFRRLQAKTQVFLSGEYDFYRTRLTHSIEVAQIGRSICNHLRASSPFLNAHFYVDPDLVEAACLAHDLGHPPFGHAGERTLNRLMRDYGGFEGNAQTLRIITEILFSRGTHRYGMNPTRAFMDSVMKYKVLLSQSRNIRNHFLYDDQEKYVDYIFGGASLPNPLKDEEVLNTFRSIECQIMDWADDTAYSLNDIVDGIHARFITITRLEKWAQEQSLTRQEARWVDQILNVMSTGEVDRAFARKIGEFIQACELEEWHNFLSNRSNRYRFRLKIYATIKKECHFYKRVARELVFRSPQLHQLEYKWDTILERLFRAFTSHYLSGQARPLKLLPDHTDQMIQQTNDPEQKARIICDHIAGMTDGFAIRTYKRLFDPDFGSIIDLV
ncbi:MAG: dNTP triphosphohydrolase [Calditrichaeota bacterium]|nr:dNTP triphosphohydrolase [Calditrichota bacterium]